MTFIRKRPWLWPVILLVSFMILSIFSNSLLFHSGLTDGQDLRFHMLRIQGLTDNIKAGIWYPYINMHFLEGFGYAVDTFYSDTFLYIASFYQIFVRDNLLQAYKFLLISITFLTLVLTYLSVKGISQSRKISFFASIMYTLSSYHFIDTYNRGALGETLAFTFVPVVIASCYVMVYRHKNVWYWLVLGMCALILSHVVTTVMMGTVLFIFLLVSYNEWKKNPSILLWFLLSACLVVGLTLFITLPLYEQMQAQPLIAQWAPIFYVTETGLNLGETLVHAFNNDDARIGLNIGILVLLAPIFRLVLLKKKLIPGDYFAIAGFITLLVCTTLFPWVLLENTPLNTIQFPWRYLVFATFFFAVGSGLYINEMMKQYQKQGLISILFLSIVFITNISLMNQTSYEVRQPNAEAFLKDTNFLGAGKEYLPTGVNLNDITPDSGPLYVNKNVKYENFDKKGSHITFTFHNSDSGEIAMPIIYYKGYIAKITEGGITYQIPVYAGITNLATFELPKGTGTVTFQYGGTRVQKISMIISSVFLVVFLCLVLFEGMKRIKLKKS